MQASDLLKALNRPANSDVLFICSTGDPGKIFPFFCFSHSVFVDFGLTLLHSILFYLSHREFQNSDNGTTSNDTVRPIYAHAVLLMARSTYFEELLFPILGKRNNDNQEYGQEDPIEIEVPDSRSVMLEVLHYIYTGQVRATPPTFEGGATQRETWLMQLEWLLLCIHASYRYDVPRMRLLCESMCEKPLLALSNPVYCLNVLIDLKKHGCNHLFETALAIVASHVHRVIDTPTFGEFFVSFFSGPSFDNPVDPFELFEPF